ncbi:MAG: MFS transporter [Lachnospiraceae bacterium]
MGTKETNQTVHMTNGRIIGYGLGALGKDLALGVISSYLLLFYTNVLGITAAAAGMILVLTKIWDAINDPIMGTIVDRTNTKWGRFRPYLLFVPLPLAIFSVLTFTAVNFSPTGKIIWAAVTYTITGMLFTAYDVPLLGMVPSITGSQEESNKCISTTRFFTSLATLLATSIAYNAIEAIGGGPEVEHLKVGYPVFMVIVGVISTAFGFVAFKCTKEKPLPRTSQDGQSNIRVADIFKDFYDILKNKPVIVLFTAMILQAIALILPNTAGAYYMIYCVGRPDLIGIYFLVTGGIGLMGAPAASLLLKKMSAKKVTMLAMGISVFVSVVALFIPITNLAVLFGLYAIYGFTVVIPMVTISVMYVEALQYLEAKRGKRSDGTVFSLNSFAIKMGTALSSGIVSLVLTVTHFNQEAFEQGAEVITGINLCRTAFLIVVYLLAILIVRQFDTTITNHGGE